MPTSIDEMVKRHLETLPERKQLPEILDEMDENIQLAADAARKAEEAARAAKQAADTAAKASHEAEKRAEEARLAGEKVAKKAIKASEEVLLRTESLEQRLKDVEESISREAHRIPSRNLRQKKGAQKDSIATTKYTIIIEKGRESGYVAYAPALKGCVSQGKTKAETIRNIKEAIEAYIGSLLEDGLPVPTEVGRDTVELEVATK